MGKSVHNMSEEEIMGMPDEEFMALPEEAFKDKSEDTSSEESDDNLDSGSTEENNQELEEESTNNQDIAESEDNDEDLDNSDELDDNSEDNSDTIQNSNNNNNRIPDYKGFYKKVMSPFKAGGKTLQLNNADEVISLMQKGIDYTKKTQDLARYRKPMLMLERAELLDEEKISFLIDVEKGNQEAIRKLLKDKNIDAFSLPSEDEPINYQTGSHIIGDNEIRLKEVCDELIATNDGQSFLTEVNNKYDAVSCRHLVEAPELLRTLYHHKQIGAYDDIVSEIDRQRMLGKLDPNVPFIEAYNTIASSMVNQGNVRPNSRNGLAGTQPIDRRAAITSNQFNNSQRAKAAGIPRSSSGTARLTKNPLEMSDEEFLKRFGE